jgi:hypothetical protein
LQCVISIRLEYRTAKEILPIVLSFTFLLALPPFIRCQDDDRKAMTAM